MEALTKDGDQGEFVGQMWGICGEHVGERYGFV